MENLCWTIPGVVGSPLLIKWNGRHATDIFIQASWMLKRLLPKQWNYIPNRGTAKIEKPTQHTFYTDEKVGKNLAMDNIRATLLHALLFFFPACVAI